MLAGIEQNVDVNLKVFKDPLLSYKYIYRN